ncbi:BspA family leucine-rich repeat surface protein [Maribacter sp. MAR_2009_72]|uniref:BspA family leucine-rich repeat surface protein n=1 Tax=Maribacter sp. MAR_2009_72 TaxID=1250050 RepID=UPI00119B31D1|nr:BspA family leucine-rich repeat surface protein [Maribacter sp. MAR_2009_72]TVZ14963.1 putative secreted protein (Por secretion system target) [Maribacter sp. MAR_2009_72]
MKKILLYIICTGLLLVSQITLGQQLEISAGPKIVCPLNPNNQFSRLGITQAQKITSNRLAGGAAVTTTFVVNYIGNPPNELREAFQFALDIWATEIVSNVPIVIDVDFLEFNGTTLASAGPYIARDFANAPLPATWYPLALANSLANQDLGPTFPDMEVTIGNRADWYFGTDGNTPAGQYDFVSVVLHEIGHGLGMAAFREPDGTFNNNGFPLIYSRFIEDVNGSDLIGMGNASPEAAALYVSNNAYINGPNSVAALNGVRPKLYAPSNFIPGSTIAHWDEFSYPAGDPNSLMTPAIGASESNFDIGDITRGHFKDMGWLLQGDNEEPIDFSNAFVTTWQTTTADESITIPTFPGETYNYSVDWGDGIIESGFTGNAAHTYATPGTYSVSIVGVFPQIFFNNTGDVQKILTIEQWGDIAWFSMDRAFYGGINLDVVAIDTPNLNNVTSLNSMFYLCSSLVGNTIFNMWEVSTIQSMYRMFEGAQSFNQPIGNWEVRNVTNMAQMFRAARQFNQDLSNWNVSNVSNTSFMFSIAQSFNQPIGNWNMQSANYMNEMFSFSAFNQDLSSWNISNAEYLNGMFKNAGSFNQNLGRWDISSVKDMSDMFEGAVLSKVNYDNTLNGWSTLDIAAGETQIPQNITFDGGNSQYCLSEAARQSLIDNFGWTITDAGLSCPNEAPEITSSATASVEENQTLAIDVDATDDIDVEGPGLTYSLTGDGVDQLLFNINNVTGVVTFMNAPDFENPEDEGGDNIYNFQVSVTDSGNLTATQDITISVIDVIEVAVCTLAITDQPQNVTLCQDDTSLTFNVLATGTGNLSYNWQALGNGLSEWTAVAEQDGTATLTLAAPAQPESSGLQYRVVIIDDQGTVDPADDCNIISNAAILTVNPLPLPLISGPNSYVEGSGGVTLDAGPGFVDYLWSTGETTQTIIVFEGNYSVEVVDDNGCTGSSEAFTISKIDSDLLITEIMYNPNGTDGVWEWIEIYNKGLQPIDLAGYVLDDNQGLPIASANIVSGIIQPQASVILYDADLTQGQFKDAWGDVNLIPVTDFPTLGNNGGDTIGIWSSYLNYNGDNQSQSNVVERVDYTNELPWPSDDGFASIYLTDLSADNQQGGNWALSTVDVATPLFTAYTSIGVYGNSGADIGSPGTPAEVDVEAPIITCSPNVTMSNDIGLCEASFPIIPATATDNVTLPENITIDFVRSDGALLTLTDPFQVGETIITWTATDEEGNTSESCEQIITVTDDELPVVTVQDITIELEANGEFVITSANFISDNVIVTQSDNCGLNGIVNFAGSTTFTCSDVGQVVTRSVGVNDINGNSSLLVSFNITVLDPLEVCKDVTPPVVTCPADVTVAFGESTDPSVTGTATATDDIGIDEITFVDVTVDQIITRTWTATDTSGNSASCNQLITIEPENDTTPPVAVCQNFTLVLNELGLGSIFATDIDNGSTDNVAIASLSITPARFNESNIGENQVKLTVTDTAGNIASCTATVTVEAAPDTISPEAVCQDFTLVLDASGLGSISPLDVDGGSTDNVGIASMSVTPSSFNEINIGTNEVILTVTDAAGNADECTAIVTVEAAPIVACPNNLQNEDPNIVLPTGTRALGVDSTLGISTDTNGSPCALGVSNQDSGQPWGTYRIAIRLADYGISAGDELFVGVDGKSLTGTARMEVNRNNAPNTAIAQRTFGSDWSRYESTFIVPAGLTSLDLWFFSNYAQSTPGVALYDNLVVRNLSDAGDNLVPIANAGNDVVIEDTDNNLVETVALNATNSIDLDGNIVSYSWTENNIIIATGATPLVEFDLGVHVVELTVVDNEGAEDTDVVQITIVEPLVVTECPDDLLNEHPAIVLPLGTVGAGVDTALGIDSDTNGSPCALEVANNDAGQPWGSYRIAIRLTDYDIRVGDELNISVDGKSLTGTARLEINRNNAPNTSLGSKTFGSEWESYNTTFTVPSDVTTLDLWFFSNYAQSSAGVALYDNLSVINLSDTGDNLIPIANAGNDVSVEDLNQDGNEAVTLNGSNSTDLDGEIVSYIWRENGSVIANGESPTVVFSVGVHEVELTVMDNQNAMDTDIVRVIVTDPLAVVCSDDLQNEALDLVLPSGTIALGVDSAIGISSDTNNSPCALQVSNNDSGQPWGSYRITIDLGAQNISSGDELYIGVDGKSLTGTARLEINRNNAPNTSLGSKTFGNEWENFNTIFTVPNGVNTLDLWFFSNYAQNTPGIALYDNLRIVKLGDEPDITAKNNEIVQPVNGLRLYPNPANIETTISFDQPTTVGTIQVFDVMGRLVRTIKGGLIDTNGSLVNVQEMPTGTYFVKTIDESGMEFQQQMLIER